MDKGRELDCILILSLTRRATACEAFNIPAPQFPHLRSKESRTIEC